MNSAISKRTANVHPARRGPYHQKKINNRKKIPCGINRVTSLFKSSEHEAHFLKLKGVTQMNPKLTIADAARFKDVSVQAIHQSARAKKIPLKTSGNRSYFTHETARDFLGIKWPSLGRVISVQVVKGGPGKTSLVKNMGIRCSLYGARCLLIDLDQQGNLTNDFINDADQGPVMIDLLDEKQDHTAEDAIRQIMPGLDLLPSRLDNSALDNLLAVRTMPLDRVFKSIIDPLRKQYDFIFIDCPPALSPSTTAAALASDEILIPVAPERYCFDGLKMTYQELQKISERYEKPLPFRIVLNKFDSRTMLSNNILETLLASSVFKDRMMNSIVRVAQEIPNSAASGASIFDGFKTTQAVEDFDLLAREFLAGYCEPAAASRSPSIPLGNLPAEVTAESRV